MSESVSFSLTVYSMHLVIFNVRICRFSFLVCYVKTDFLQNIYLLKRICSKSFQCGKYVYLAWDGNISNLLPTDWEDETSANWPCLRRGAIFSCFSTLYADAKCLHTFLFKYKNMTDAFYNRTKFFLILLSARS